MKKTLPVLVAVLLASAACDRTGVNLNTNPELNAAAGTPMTMSNGPGASEPVVNPINSAIDEQKARERGNQTPEQK